MEAKVILDSRIIEKNGKMFYQNYVANHFEENDGYLEFNFKNAKWVDVFSFKKGTIIPCKVLKNVDFSQRPAEDIKSDYLYGGYCGKELPAHTKRKN